ncbi:signal transduction histidine kinase [Streptococcus rupicaprae]|uniref:histidine kinase n=1 Tax=Streptococcus rupicaprae TaxID=759619 RepID=A0ABV2FF74_9STRE
MQRFLNAYLRSRFLWIGSAVSVVFCLFLFSKIFEAVQDLLIYQLSLIVLMISVVVSMDIAREWRKFRDSQENRLLDEAFLSPSERVLQSQLKAKQEELKMMQLRTRKNQEETMDYFTLWAHQIKIPLTASNLLLKELKKEPNVKQLEQELFRLGQYADMAMAYLRLESFHEDLVLEKEDVHVLVREVLKKFTLFFIRNSLRLEFADFEYWVVTDRKWLMVVLEQVLSNAIKYTRSGIISIYMKGDTLVIADTGIGIQVSDVQRVFERGFSGFNGRVNQQSSGLGLYLSKTIMEKLGHQIELTSQVGQGTQVKLHFPQKSLAQD